MQTVVKSLAFISLYLEHKQVARVGAPRAIRRDKRLRLGKQLLRCMEFHASDAYTHNSILRPLTRACFITM
jgi:hypothetical protein